jgi:hypothetical protein
VRLYRVFPWLASARDGEPGHPLHAPSPQGGGRADNPDHYLNLYLSSLPAGAVAEAFGRLAWWVPEMFAVPGLPGSARALATCDVPDDAAICDLDDASSLVSLALRPSEVVTRDVGVTQRWALRVYQERRWVGVRWWSYYDARWHSYALWGRSGLSVSQVERLHLDHPAVVEASDVLGRPRGKR